MLIDIASEGNKLDMQGGFKTEQVQKIAQMAVEQVVGTENVIYQADKVNEWC